MWWIETLWSSCETTFSSNFMVLAFYFFYCTSNERITHFLPSSRALTSSIHTRRRRLNLCSLWNHASCTTPSIGCSHNDVSLILKCWSWTRVKWIVTVDSDFRSLHALYPPIELIRCHDHNQTGYIFELDLAHISFF